MIKVRIKYFPKMLFKFIFSKVIFFLSAGICLSEDVDSFWNSVPDFVFEDTFRKYKENSQPIIQRIDEKSNGNDFLFPDNNFDPDRNKWSHYPTNKPNWPVSETIPTTPSTFPQNNVESRRNCELNCFTTPQYDPVCAEDDGEKTTFFNEQKMICAQRCGANIKFLFKKPCPRQWRS